MLKKIAIIVVFLLYPPLMPKAQYYDWGQGPSSVKWRTVKTPDIKYIFPDYYEPNAMRLVNYFDTIRPLISYGFTHGPMKRMPLIMHTQNFSSNGIVMLAPRRMEFIVSPMGLSGTMPWLKQLAVHEYRHAVQYNNINRGIIRGLGWIIGQQATLIGLGLMPVWMLEGDAVMAETRMSTFGRGLQPSFTIEYRAMVLEGRKRFAVDKYFSGSYKDYMPDHYQLGYQITSWAYTKYGENIWNKTTRYGSRYPFLLLTNAIALKKYYDTSVTKLFNETFDDLDRFWRSLPLDDNSASPVATPIDSYTTYLTPKALNDSMVVAVKSDLRRPNRLVMVNIRTGEERVLCYTGSISTGLNVGENIVYWTENRQSVFWEQRINSVLCSYDIATGRKQTHSDERHLLYPVIMPDGKVAGVEYDYTGSFSIKHAGWSIGFPSTVSIHGLAYDDLSEKFYFIALDDAGMWIGSAAPGSRDYEMVTEPNHITISNLTSAGGSLFYNSIQSGKDEAHRYDIPTGREYRLTTSRYGSFSPAEIDDESIVLTTYTTDGYLLSVQKVSTGEEIGVESSRLPENMVNPVRAKWNIGMNIDDITVADTTSYPVKKYRKGLNLFKFHSWAPVEFDPEVIVNEIRFDINAGVTVMSQNELNSVFARFGYAWSNGYSVLRGKVSYRALAPKFDIEAEWSNMNKLVYGSEALPPASTGKYFDIIGRAYLPALLTSGAFPTSLTPMVEIEHNNALLYDYLKAKYINGYQKVVFSLQYVGNMRMAYRDFRPKLGFAVRISHTIAPFNSNFGSLWHIYGRLYLPGIVRPHSLMLRGVLQHQNMDTYNFRQKEVFPRGADFNFTPAKYAAVSADYQLPVCYPDWGINSFLFFKRIRANLAFDYARYQRIFGTDQGQTFQGNWHNLYSYGLDLYFDISALRMPSSLDSSLSVSVHKPSDKNGAVVGAGISIVF